MRKVFANCLYEWMKKDDRIWLICIDLGFGKFDRIRDEFPDRFLNPGAAEQVALDIAVGLALEGKIPFVYSITPFLIYRPFETLRTYVNKENIPVKLCGSGRDFDYKHDGWSHHSPDVRYFLDGLKNIKQLWPGTKEEIPEMVKLMIEDKNPYFISLKT